jgi:hypothetical protein
MPSNPAVSIMVKLHADIGGRIQANKEEPAKLQEDVHHVEAVIQLFDLSFSLRKIAPPDGTRAMRSLSTGPSSARACGSEPRASSSFIVNTLDSERVLAAFERRKCWAIGVIYHYESPHM